MRAIWRLQHCKNFISLNKLNSQTLPLGLFSIPSFRFRVAISAKSHISTASFISPSNRQETVMSESKPQEEAKPVENVETKTEEELPPLSDHEFKIYNRAADHMEYFHNNFRRSWNLLWNACANNRRPQGMSLKQFIMEGLQFAEHLTMHHNIEETYIFPVLAKKMPEFRGGRAELLRQHKQIHAGLDHFEEYLKKCRTGDEEFELSVLKTKMETWGEVLWKHLDQEVETLGANNMRKYWTKEEVMRLPM
ncbi:uncharacterized protein BKA55DRAFT_573660 [Fusarium redolens]|uniref:Hemerythrin-like domain-containing protein n=1 Tax=Fusarium redolens TaxID=48865 RepID=A0A9P9GTR9_FUSRE|nr:uncharacterized protein BKA55DRAFT_573660 [Fusarium redolens]KAH7244329.1 hypothetical protein BKA55DRAFT_573660 [Fusarium redolens]